MTNHGTGGVYIASKTRHAGRWRELRDAGVPVISSWIDEAGEGQTVDWRDLWDRCIAEASSASALILYAEPGEVLQGALVEVGAALASGVPVFYVVPENIAAAGRHPLVTQRPTLDAALLDACNLCAPSPSPSSVP